MTTEQITNYLQLHNQIEQLANEYLNKYRELLRARGARRNDSYCYGFQNPETELEFIGIEDGLITFKGEYTYNGGDTDHYFYQCDPLILADIDGYLVTVNKTIDERIKAEAEAKIKQEQDNKKFIEQAKIDKVKREYEEFMRLKAIFEKPEGGKLY